jgi:hypothetical protein
MQQHFYEGSSLPENTGFHHLEQAGTWSNDLDFIGRSPPETTKVASLRIQRQ